MKAIALIYCTLLVCVSYVFAGLPSVCPEFVSKKKWNGKTAIKIEYTIIPAQYVIVHHTVTPECSDENKCAQLVRNIQNFHMEDPELEFDDIGYNFLVGGDGRVYEGAGWHTQGAHTFKYNRNSIGLGVIGDFSNKLPNQKQLNATKNFLECAEQLGELEDDYKLLGGRQLISSESPGLKMYRELQTWKHYSRTP